MSRCLVAGALVNGGSTSKEAVLPLATWPESCGEVRRQAYSPIQTHARGGLVQDELSDSTFCGPCLVRQHLGRNPHWQLLGLPCGALQSEFIVSCLPHLSEDIIAKGGTFMFVDKASSSIDQSEAA